MNDACPICRQRCTRIIYQIPTGITVKESDMDSPDSLAELGVRVFESYGFVQRDFILIKTYLVRSGQALSFNYDSFSNAFIENTNISREFSSLEHFRCFLYTFNYLSENAIERMVSCKFLARRPGLMPRIRDFLKFDLACLSRVHRFPFPALLIPEIESLLTKYPLNGTQFREKFVALIKIYTEKVWHMVAFKLFHELVIFVCSHKYINNFVRTNTFVAQNTIPNRDEDFYEWLNNQQVDSKSPSPVSFDHNRSVEENRRLDQLTPVLDYELQRADANNNRNRRLVGSSLNPHNYSTDSSTAPEPRVEGRPLITSSSSTDQPSTSQVNVIESSQSNVGTMQSVKIEVNGTSSSNQQNSTLLLDDRAIPSTSSVHSSTNNNLSHTVNNPSPQSSNNLMHNKRVRENGTSLTKNSSITNSNSSSNDVELIVLGSSDSDSSDSEVELLECLPSKVRRTDSGEFSFDILLFQLIFFILIN